MKIYDLLIEDHNKVKGLLDTLMRKYDPKLFKELANELTLHNEAEEAAFYEPLRSKAANLEVIVNGAHEEHDLTIEMVDQLEKLTDEEDIFKFAEKHFTDKQAQEMVSTMQQAKERFKEKTQKYNA